MLYRGVAAAKLVGADVGVLPGPQHRQQVVGVAAAEIGLPAVDQEVLQRGEADLAPYLIAIERLAQPPAGIDPAHRLEAARRRDRPTHHVAGQCWSDAETAPPAC